MFRRFISLAALVSAALAPAAQAQSPPFNQPNAVLINISEADLNRIVRGAFRAGGGPRFEGGEEETSRGISDLEYRADVSEPELELGDDGTFRLSLEVLEGWLRIGRIERELLSRRTFCENLGVRVDPDRPVDIALQFRLLVEDGELQIIPQELQLSNAARNFELVKPSRCGNSFLPTWLLWWLGKHRLRKQLDSLDEVLLTKARESAAELNGDEGLLHKHWRIRPDPASERRMDLYLYPQTLDTSHGSLFVSLATSGADRARAASGPPEWASPLLSRSFLGLSESFVNAALQATFKRINDTPYEPSGGLDRLFKSRSIRTLLPGVRQVESGHDVYLTFRLSSAPEIRFERIDSGAGPARAVIRLRLSDVEMRFWETDGSSAEELAMIEIVSGRLALVPYANVIGGISFEIHENDWTLASREVELDEELLAAVFQEIVFGEVFETQYEPVAKSLFDVGEEEFRPRYFDRVGNHLVIGLGDF